MNTYTCKIIGLYRLDYTAGYHLRQMAGLLGVSHVTLLPHLRELLQSKLLVSKKVGRSKLISLNPENLLVKDHILLSELSASTAILEKHFLLKKVYSEIFALAPAGSVALFGSFAKHAEDEQSDMEILYIGENGEQFATAMRRAGSLYGKSITVKKTSLENFEKALRSRDALVTEVLKNHILLYRPSVFVDSAWRYFREIR